MRFDDTTQLDVGAAQAYEPYAPEPIEHEVTEVIQRLYPAVDDDFEPEPLPPAPARGSQTFPVVTVYPRFR
jgi:hypothetical protein